MAKSKPQAKLEQVLHKEEAIFAVHFKATESGSNIADVVKVINESNLGQAKIVNEKYVEITASNQTTAVAGYYIIFERGQVSILAESDFKAQYMTSDELDSADTSDLVDNKTFDVLVKRVEALEAKIASLESAGSNETSTQTQENPDSAAEPKK